MDFNMSRGEKLGGLFSVFCRNFDVSVETTAVGYFLFNFGRSTSGWKFVICGCMWSMKCIEEFVYKLGICCRIEENQGEHWLIWSGSTSSGRNPISSKQPCSQITERTHFSVTKNNRLMFFRKTTAVYFENHSNIHFGRINNIKICAVIGL
jgi:hypothetical protein